MGSAKRIVSRVGQVGALRVGVKLSLFHASEAIEGLSGNQVCGRVVNFFGVDDAEGGWTLGAAGSSEVREADICLAAVRTNGRRQTIQQIVAEGGGQVVRIRCGSRGARAGIM